ncbi:MAG: porin, partial [Nitrospirae bacterium]
PDAFGEWDYFSLFRIRVGKFKSPIGLEMLQAPQNLSLMERSLTRNLLPNRDLGAMVWGVYQRGLLEYQVGIFNGAPNANFYQESAATSSAKTLEARVFSRPFLDGSADWLKGLGLGVGMSAGSVKQSNGQDPMQTETFSYTFFQYNSTVTGDGERIRITPQAAWYWGRLGLLGQYVRSTQQLRLVTGTQSVRTTHDAWSTQASWFLTDDTATFGHVQPRRPVEPSKGYWGAWEIAVRYAQLNIDPLTFAYNLADPGISVLRTKSSTVGLNWYLNSNVRLTANFVHTDFTGATQAYHAASHEDGLMFRTQLTF